jgi:nucleotide-binding universal stress UspA family protein
MRRRPLRIVHAFAWPPAGWTGALGRALPPRLPERDRAEACVVEATEVAAKLMPADAISAEVIAGDVLTVLPAESRHAVLLVLGDRRGGGFHGLIAGSVAVRATPQAACPVLVVRGHPRPDGPVVVGADGSPNSAAALEFAADEAERRGAELVALHAWNGGDSTELNAGLPLTYEFWAGPDEEERVLAESLAGIAAQHPGLSIHGQVRRGSARRLLQELSRSAQLIVVGDRGHGGFGGLLVGSVSQHLVYHAGCPTVVVRPALLGATG